MGIESVFACNMQNNKELTAEGEKRFRMLWQPIMSAVSHARSVCRASGLVQIANALNENIYNGKWKHDKTSD
jgi:hypothetical protein